jgi:hypothetical protein
MFVKTFFSIQELEFEFISYFAITFMPLSLLLMSFFLIFSCEALVYLILILLLLVFIFFSSIVRLLFNEDSDKHLIIINLIFFKGQEYQPKVDNYSL